MGKNILEIVGMKRVFSQIYKLAITVIHSIAVINSAYAEVSITNEYTEIKDVYSSTLVKNYKSDNREIVNICNLVSSPEIINYYSRKDPREAIEKCEVVLNNSPEEYKECIYKNGSGADIAVLYANGKYVPQDFWKAISYICYSEDDSFNYELMLKNLYKATKIGDLKKEFDLCDYVWSPEYEAACFIYQEKETFEQINKNFEKISVFYTEEQKTAYQELLKSAFKFFENRANGEIVWERSASYTLAKIMQLQEQEKWFLEIIEKIEADELKIEKENYTDVNRDMKLEYQKVIALLKGYDQLKLEGTHLPARPIEEDIKRVQRYFLVFRECFASWSQSFNLCK